jgi:hypothetical protein
MMNVEEAVRETVDILNKLKPCKSCVFANEDCTWCSENRIKIAPFQYGCRKYMTNEDAVRKLAELEYKKYKKEMARITLDMDVMGYTINAASIMLEKIDKELERSYNSIKEKTEDSIKKHNESKRNRDRLRKAYAQMKFNATDMRNTYDRYIEYFFATQFTDADGKYNDKESDKNLANSGVISKVIKVFVDRALDNEENANKILDFMLSLQGTGLYEEHDFNVGIIRK